MSHFADERVAKEFLVRSILSEAEREGIFLSELEREMLYFSESGWTLPGMAETAKRFERECDSAKYEKKIRALARKLQKRLQSDDPPALKLWSDALHKLRQGDHYLLVMAPATSSSRRPPHDLLKLFMTALIIVLVVEGMLILLSRLSAQPLTREAWAFLTWVTALFAAFAFLLLSLILGRQRATNLLDTLMAKIFGVRASKR